MSQSISLFNGDKAYLDTMILYALLRNINPDIVKPLFQRIHTGKLQAYTSVLTFDELVYRLLLSSIRDHHPGNPLTHLRSDETNLIAAFYPPIAAKINQLQTFPNLTLVNVTPVDLDLMHQYILDYQLRPRDALHLAAMQQCECQVLFSNDKDFDRVPTIQRFTTSEPV